MPHELGSIIATRVNNARLNVVDFLRESEPFELPTLDILMRKGSIAKLTRLAMRQPLGRVEH